LGTLQSYIAAIADYKNRGSIVCCLRHGACTCGRALRDLERIKYPLVLYLWRGIAPLISGIPQR
jgi:hypothetical protein